MIISLGSSDDINIKTGLCWESMENGVIRPEKGHEYNLGYAGSPWGNTVIRRTKGHENNPGYAGSP